MDLSLQSIELNTKANACKQSEITLNRNEVSLCYEQFEVAALL